MRKLSERDAELIRDLYRETNQTISSLARSFKVSIATISVVLDRKGAYKSPTIMGWV